MERHLSTLQDIVRLTIRQELEWSERRLKRVVMSHDASDNPAELYGADGKIYYRKAGGVGAELGTGGGGLWESPGAVTELIAPEPVLLEDDLTLYDGTSLSPEVELKAYTAESVDGAYLTASTGYFWVTRISDDSILARCELSSQKWRLQGELDMTYSDVVGVKVLKGYSTFDLSFWDAATGTKTLSQLAAGGYSHPSARQCTTGTWAWASISGKPSTYPPSSHTHDSRYYTETEINTWRAATTQTEMGYVHGVTSDIQTQLNAGISNPLTGTLNMAGHTLDNAGRFDANDTLGIDIYNSSGVSRGAIATTDYALQCLGGGIHMNSQKIALLGAGSAGSSDAARMVDLDSYLPLAAGSGKPLTGDLYMGGKNIREVLQLFGSGDSTSLVMCGGSGTYNPTLILYGKSGMYPGYVQLEVPNATSSPSALLTPVWVEPSTAPFIEIGYGIEMHGKDIVDVGEIKGVLNVNMYVKPQGTGILYLG